MDDCHPIQLPSLVLVTLGLRCRVQTFSSCGEWGLLFTVVRGLLIEAASLLWNAGSVVVAHGVSSYGTWACGIFLDQGSNQCPLQWQVDA